MLSREQASAMLSLQAEMNRKIDPQWVAAAYPYLRAVIVEGSEAIEHHGWKWWKKQDRDLAQLQMELVDIWHFLLSEILLREGGNQKRALASLMRLLDAKTADEEIDFDGRIWRLDRLDLLEKFELLIGLSANRRVDLTLFGSILHDCKMEWLDLYRQYVGKNVLNTFRQDHGYKEGRYRKLWSGREDNEFLAEILADADPEQPDYRELVYSELAKRYPA
ncbi:MAG: dUTP diphosphatase [Gammaproteobacteria bacterium]|nr:dUTP diphosphatase [Gammaproteobacteria bacterium]MYE99231.1 dUTP diphosphatase [Gammaproteobacteria bacterium]MYH86018.1 dUTP diphosphatase [Gammaproteobacteria bacterium]MYK04123.1 dUTP diphosphatase [Gammaproteobacteria bacterium]